MAYQQIVISQLSRILCRDRIALGDWYFAVVCKGCGESVPLIKDPWEGKHHPAFIGDGKVVTSCRQCLGDFYYETSEIKPIRIGRDVPQLCPPRVEPSKLPRQPLKIAYPGVRPTFGSGLIELRPKAAAIVARCIGYYSEVEALHAQLLASMLQANTEPAVAMFLSIHASRTQQSVLDSVAANALSPEDDRLFRALMNFSKSVEKERNALAHGIFGFAEQIPYGLPWIDAINYVKFGTKLKLGPVNEVTASGILDYVFVYELADLERIAQDTENLHSQLNFFLGYMSALREDAPDKHRWRAQRYIELCAEPRIAQELALLKDR